MSPDDPFNFRERADPLIRGFLELIDWLELIGGLLEMLLNW